MLVNILKSKIHKAIITQADLHYEGSLGIDQDLMDEVGMLPYERILVCNNNNGNRLETYAIPAERGSKKFLLNGAAARLGTVGDQIIIMSFAQMDAKEADGFMPKRIVMNDKNEIMLRK